MKVLFSVLFLLAVMGSTAWGGCPTNELIQNAQTPIIFSFEKRDGTGEDTTNIGNKRVSFAYYNGTAWRWYNGTDWSATSENLRTMTQLTGGQYYFLLPAAALDATVADKFVVIRFDDLDDVDVTLSCLSYVQPEKRLTINKVWDEPKTSHTTAGTFGYYLDAQVSAAGGGGAADWTTDEKNQIRYRIGIDGTEAAPVTNTPTLGTLTANVADKTGFSLAADQSGVTIGTVGTVTNPVTAGTVSDKTGFSLSSAGIDAILNDTIEGSYTARQVLCAAASVLFGKASGGATTAITFRNLGDTLNRVSETVDANGNRSAVTLNLTGCQ